MAEKIWRGIKTIKCTHIGCDVELEVQEVYPADFMPDQMVRVTGHRCSHGVSCSLDDAHTCVWAGTNPGYDPFKVEKGAGE